MTEIETEEKETKIERGAQGMVEGEREQQVGKGSKRAGKKRGGGNKKVRIEGKK